MNKENFNKTLENAIKNIREYIDLKTELYTLIVFERISKLLSKFLVVIVFVFFLFFFILFLSLAFISWFDKITDTGLWGYLIVALFYLILGAIVYALRKRLFLDPMIKDFTNVMFEQEDLLDSQANSKQENERD